MSLLIDALKKAEQEKKEAAKRLKEAQEKSGEGIQLQTTDTTPAPAAAATTSSSSPQEQIPAVSASPTEKKSPSGLSLSPLDESVPGGAAAPETAATYQPTEKPSAALALKKEITIEHPAIPDTDDADLGDEREITDNSGKTFAMTSLSIEDTASAPYEDATGATLTERLKDTISDTRLSKSVLTAAELVRDIGSSRETPTPVAAQTVFTAVAGVSGKRQVFEWIMFLGLFTVTLLAAGTFYFLNITPSTPETSSPLVAKGVEAEPVSTLVLPAPVDSASNVVSGAVVSPDQAPEPTMPSAVPAEEEIAAIESSPSIPAPGEAMETPPAAPEPSATTEIPVDYPEEDLANAAPQKPVAMPDEILVDAAAIRISRTKSVDAHGQLINTAYAEYNRGNLEVAKAAYLGVLKELPDNRDALLGMAAIAQRGGDVQGAYERYLRVLKLYPKDAVANTALINLNLGGNIDPVKTESLVKLMIQEQPQAAFLHFTLGNVYAAQSRWTEAQLAFFDAHRLGTQNPDYAYNLAVSLDHIGQSQAATEYYQRALELADETTAGFSTAAVLARVNNLSTTSGR